LKEKVCFTMDGRKKRLLVDDDNHLVEVLEDLGPLNEMEKTWVRSGCELPYKEWLDSLKDEDETGNGDGDGN